MDIYALVDLLNSNNIVFTAYLAILISVNLILAMKKRERKLTYLILLKEYILVLVSVLVILLLILKNDDAYVNLYLIAAVNIFTIPAMVRAMRQHVNKMHAIVMIVVAFVLNGIFANFTVALNEDMITKINAFLLVFIHFLIAIAFKIIIRFLDIKSYQKE